MLAGSLLLRLEPHRPRHQLIKYSSDERFLSVTFTVFILTYWLLSALTCTRGSAVSLAEADPLSWPLGMGNLISCLYLCFHTSFFFSFFKFKPTSQWRQQLYSLSYMSVPIPNSHITATVRTLDPPRWNLWLLGDLSRRLWEFLRAEIAMPIHAAWSELMATHKTIDQKKHKVELAERCWLPAQSSGTLLGFQAAHHQLVTGKQRWHKQEDPHKCTSVPVLTLHRHRGPIHLIDSSAASSAGGGCVTLPTQRVCPPHAHTSPEPFTSGGWGRNPICIRVLGGRRGKDEWGPFHLSWSVQRNPLALTDEVKIVKLENVQLLELQGIYLIHGVVRVARGGYLYWQACGKVRCLWPCSHSDCRILSNGRRAGREKRQSRNTFPLLLFISLWREALLFSCCQISVLFFFFFWWAQMYVGGVGKQEVLGGTEGLAHLSWP